MAHEPVALMIQGGAGPIKAEDYPHYQDGIERILSEVTPMLVQGASALDTVERAVMLLEENPRFNTGFGSALREDGSVRLDASIMDGSTLNCGAVACVRNLPHPVSVARRIMETTSHILLVGDGANEFAREQGFEEVSEETLIIARQRQRWERRKAEGGLQAKSSASGGTVGAVAWDRQGRLAAATSTAGTFFSHPARVGDTPVIGAGTYADETAAVSATGVGEAIIKVVLSKTCVDLVRSGLSPQEAADAAIALLSERTRSSAGLIVVDAKGRVGSAHCTERMAFGSFTSSEGVRLPPVK